MAYDTIHVARRAGHAYFDRLGEEGRDAFIVIPLGKLSLLVWCLEPIVPIRPR